MLAAIQRHCDDIPIFAAGTVLKLVDEGYDGNGAGNGKSTRKTKSTRARCRRLPLLGIDAETNNRQYTKYFALTRDRAPGEGTEFGAR